MCLKGAVKFKKMLNTLILAVLFIGGLVFVYRAYILPAIQKAQLMNEYQNIAEPRLICQVGENDDEFWARVQRERLRFESVGNQWANKQSPVIAIPFNAAFRIVWFGKNYDYSSVGLGQMEYHRMAMEIYKLLCTAWSRETNINFGDAAVQAAKGATEFDEAKLWN